MLKHAINPHNEKLITVKQWIVEPNLQMHNNRDDKKRYVEGNCPVCGENVYVKADVSRAKTIHFSHNRNANCPLSRARREPINIDYTYCNDDIEELKREINDNIYKIYYKCYQLCNNDLTYTEFIRMCNHFREANGINYRGITAEYIPYVLVHLAGIIRNEFFFALNYNVQRGNDLWENPNQNGIILKINIEKSSTKEDCLPIEINGDFFNEDRTKTGRFIQKEEEIKRAIGII